MKRENTQLIKAVIEEFIKEERLEEGLGRARLFKAWDLVVGEVGTKATTNKYFKDGDVERNPLTEFNSHNTELLNVEQVKEKLLSLQYIRDELDAQNIAY